MSHLLITLALLLGIYHAQAAELTTSCGWYDNSSPQNVSFIDAQGEWIISTQGGHKAKGPAPHFGKEFVTHQASYGYGCACLKAIKDSASKKILEIKELTEKKLSECRDDKKLSGKFPPEVALNKKPKTIKLDSFYLGNWNVTNEDCASGRLTIITDSVIRFEGEADKNFKVVDEWSDITTWIEILNPDKEDKDEKYFRLKKLSPNTLEIHTSEEVTTDELLGGLTCILKKR